MPAIVTITFSPCIDKSTSVPSLIPEKKLQCSAPQFDPGGGGINVARAIHQLGGTATAIFPSGGFTGQFFNQLLQKEGIPHHAIVSKEATRENIIIVDESTGQQYRFGMPGTPIAEREWIDCLFVLESMKDIKFLVASGSVPPGVPVDIYGELAAITKRKKAKCIVDTSGEALRHAVDSGVYLIKPNLGELSALTGKGKLTAAEVRDTAMEMVTGGKCEVVVVSMGADGAMVVARDLVETITPPPVKRVSTVGAGDSMVAGIVYYLSQGRTLSEAVRYGVACGTAATMNPGTMLCRKENADRFYSVLAK
jgi:6-phosphofructokinase 2